MLNILQKMQNKPELKKKRGVIVMVKPKILKADAEIAEAEIAEVAEAEIAEVAEAEIAEVAEAEIAEVAEAEKAEVAEAEKAEVDKAIEDVNPDFDVQEFIDKVKKPKKMIKVVTDAPKVFPKRVLDFAPIPRDTRQLVNIKAPAYIMNNREKFINFINKLFLPYKKLIQDSGEITCDNLKDNVNRELMIHQQIVRDYINLFTPYRGLLLFHGLGSGKTCSSISIAEGMKNQKQVIIMTPASLRDNYITQLKECGDFMYKLNQNWELTSATTEETILELHRTFSIPVDTIRKNRGAWLVKPGPPNYSSLSSEDKKLLNNQINDMIHLKYLFISYNGITMKKWMEYNDGRNFFDNKVIVIDEAHNFISRIVNKLNSVSTKSKKPLAILMYENLMSCTNAKIVLLTGTPVVNYPNEIGILFNILRGYIKTWEFKLDFKGELKKENLFDILTIDNPDDNVDYYDYTPNTKTLTVTENPLGFENIFQRGRYSGVNFDNNNYNFLSKITNVLSEHGIKIGRQKVDFFKCLPDNLDEFSQMFINDMHLKNTNLLKKRIVGLTSYFKSAQEELMPSYGENDLHVREIPMSDYQFEVYEKARINERQSERNAKKTRARKTEEEAVASYRIFSRLFCNFVMPEEIGRPMPNEMEGGMPKKDKVEPEPFGVQWQWEEKKGAPESSEKETKPEKAEPKKTKAKADEKEKKAEKKAEEKEAQEVKEDEDFASIEVEEGEDVEDIKGPAQYKKNLMKSFKALSQSSFLTEESLRVLSPKFLDILKNIKNEDHIGLHLVYSQFRTMEGVGIFGEVLRANGFVEFKIEKKSTGWDITSPIGVPSFALYSGTETKEEKEIIRKIFNGEWHTVGFHPLIFEKLKDYESNMYGEIIKVLMITASGSEGINLKNTRYVHIMEPYWHPARTDQVIGRARRICSHQQLPPELRTVEVFLYIMIFTEEQIKKDTAVELRKNDTSKRDPRVYLTSDGALYEINVIKSIMIRQVTQVIKESAIDCAIHPKSDDIQCMNFGTNPSGFATTPSYNKDVDDKTRRLNVETKKWQATEWSEKGILYAVNEETGIVYDHSEYEKNNLIPVGVLRNGRILLD